MTFHTVYIPGGKRFTFCQVFRELRRMYPVGTFGRLHQKESGAIYCVVRLNG